MTHFRGEEEKRNGQYHQQKVCKQCSPGSIGDSPRRNSLTHISIDDNRSRDRQHLADSIDNQANQHLFILQRQQTSAWSIGELLQVEKHSQIYNRDNGSSQVYNTSDPGYDIRNRYYLAQAFNTFDLLCFHSQL